MNKKLTMLMILDGFGINDKTEGNAIKLANTPNIDRIMKEYPTNIMHASGVEVGLPEGQMGNSEVGHINIGAGRIVYQEPMRIKNAIEDKTFFDIKELNEAIEHCQKNNTKLHLMGLMSDGGVHSKMEHCYAVMELCKSKGFDNVYIHFFSDGRDKPVDSGIGFAKELEEKIKEIGVGKVATVIGRYFAMDRDKHWDRIEKAYKAMVLGEGKKANSLTSAIENSYKEEVFDEFIEPTVITEDGKIEDGDSVVFFNYRHDRAREISRAIVDKDFKEFEVKDLKDIYYVCMTEYDSAMPNVHVAFKPEVIQNTFAEYISKKGLTQLRIAETEKYAHVTFFFNGGLVENQYEGEDRIVVPSPKVPTFDLKPEMSCPEVTDKVIEAIKSQKYDCIILNYANPDMVGHTGILEAAIKAIEAIDEAVGRVVKVIEEEKANLIITADHGNIEQMVIYETGAKHTAHTANIVPVVLITEDKKKIKEGKLSDLAPTMLELMNVEKPVEMTGESLIIH